MHHIHKLADLNKEGRREQPLWMKSMISRKRQSMPLCSHCHDDIHAKRLTSKRQGNRRAGGCDKYPVRVGGGLGEKADRTSLAAYPAATRQGCGCYFRFPRFLGLQ